MGTRSERRALLILAAFLAAGWGLGKLPRAARLGPWPDGPLREALESAWTASAPKEDSAREDPPPRPRKRDFRGWIDPDRADTAAWARLPGIGAKTAAAIVAYRRAHGHLRAPEDLLEIKGIGEKKLARMRPFLRFARPGKTPPTPSGPRLLPDTIQE